MPASLGTNMNTNKGFSLVFWYKTDAMYVVEKQILKLHNPTNNGQFSIWKYYNNVYLTMTAAGWQKYEDSLFALPNANTDGMNCSLTLRIFRLTVEA
jgi:hypothetical protein